MYCCWFGRNIQVRSSRNLSLFLGISLQGFLPGLLKFSIPASDPLAVEFVLDMRSDPKFSGVPEAVHLAGEVLGELR